MAHSRDLDALRAFALASGPSPPVGHPREDDRRSHIPSNPSMRHREIDINAVQRSRDTRDDSFNRSRTGQEVNLISMPTSRDNREGGFERNRSHQALHVDATSRTTVSRDTGYDRNRGQHVADVDAMSRARDGSRNRDRSRDRDRSQEEANLGMVPRTRISRFDRTTRDGDVIILDDMPRSRDSRERGFDILDRSQQGVNLDVVPRPRDSGGFERNRVGPEASLDAAPKSRDIAGFAINRAGPDVNLDDISSARDISGFERSRVESDVNLDAVPRSRESGGFVRTRHGSEGILDVPPRSSESRGSSYDRNRSGQPSTADLVNYLDEDEDELSQIYGMSDRKRQEEVERTKLAEKRRKEAQEERERAEKELAKLHFKVLRFMFQSGLRLRVKAIPMASAATVYHKFFEQCSIEDYDPYLIATTALYIGHKVEEDYVKIRDVINVCHRTLHPDKPPLDLGSTYAALRDSVQACELLVMRVLKFHLAFRHPHKYMLHYLKSLVDWLDPRVAERVPLARTAWTILSDSYHGKVCLKYQPQEIAVAVVYFSTQCHGIEVPYSREAENLWYESLCDGVSLQKIRQIMSEIMDTYNLEVKV